MLCGPGQSSFASHTYWRSTPERKPAGSRCQRHAPDRESSSVGQLSLFSETNESEISNNLTEGQVHDRNNDTHTTRTSHPGALETLSADDGRETGSRNQLQQTVFAAQELTGDLRYELTVVQRMDYQFAWEIATKEWAFLPDGEDQPPVDFRSSDARPHQPLPAISA
jgi:hypothetical protein